MSALLPPAVHDRFVKLCGLLTSDADGERATAARMASDLLRQHKLTWAEMVGQSCSCRAEPKPQPRQQPPSWSTSWRNLAWHCQENADLLTPWEARFIASILQRWRLTPRQEDVLDRIVDKLEEAGR